MYLKNRRSAFIMSTIAVVSYVAAEFAISMVMEYRKMGTIPGLFEEFAAPLQYWLVAIEVVFIIMGILMGGWLIQRFFNDECYYGWSGALCWAVFGLLTAVAAQAYRTVENSLPLFLKGIVEISWIAIAWVIALLLIPRLFRKIANRARS